MAFFKQTFNLIKQSAKYKSMIDATEDMMFTREEFDAYDRKLTNQKKAVQKAGISTVASGVSLLAFAYNYGAKTTRFGLRGQDIQDQLKLQDKMVNKAFGIIGAGIVGGPAAALGAIGATIISEAVSLSIANKAYEYRKSIDEQQKAIMQEKIGRAVYNSSRRA